MQFKYANISSTPTKEELQKEIARLEILKTDFNNKDQGTKIILNSIYGVAGYKNYPGYHIDVAASITGQSRDIINFTEDRINAYFIKIWHMDHELHQKLGIKTPPRCDMVLGNRDGDDAPGVVNYCDTDSIFFIMERVYKQSGYDGDFVDFSLKVYEYRLKDWVAKKLAEYVQAYNALPTKKDGQPSFKLTLENLCHSVLWVGKKKYVKNLAWKKGAKFNSLDKLEFVGLESNKASVPKFVRDKLIYLVKRILKASEDGIDIANMLQFEIRLIRTEFDMLEYHQMCKAIRVTDYESCVINDQTLCEFKSSAKPHTKGAVYYNYLINSDTKYNYANYLPRIQSGMKVHTYAVAEGDFRDFSFPLGKVPDVKGFAPRMDVEAQFKNEFLGPLNNIVKALGIIDVKTIKQNSAVIPPMW